MPDARSHRGPDPRDADLFGRDALPSLREAVADLSWLLGRGYAEPSSLKLVGDRYRLIDRQRMAVIRSACGESARVDRQGRRVDAEGLGGRPLSIDGFNILTTVEAALGGGVTLLGRDGSLRDIAGVHGTDRRVEETMPAIDAVGGWLERSEAGPCRWLLDRPVSNSGRLRGMLREVAADRGWPWEVDLPFNPDLDLIDATADVVVATADAGVLDRCGGWLPLARLCVRIGRVGRLDRRPVVDPMAVTSVAGGGSGQ